MIMKEEEKIKSKISNYQGAVFVLVILCGIFFFLMSEKQKELNELKKIYSICQDDVLYLDAN